MKATQPLQSCDFPGIISTPSSDGSLLIGLTESGVGSRDTGPLAGDVDEWCRGDLLRMKEWLTLALQSAEIGVWEWDISTGLFRTSNNWTELAGFVGKDAAPRTIGGWLSRVHAEDRAACDRFVASLLSSPGVTWQVEFRLQRVDGSFGWQLCKGRQMPGPDGVACLAVGVLVEITAQREALARLHQVERLEAVGQLSGGLAHDFNNLLTVIQGNVDLLADDLGDDPASAPMLEEISMVVARGSALTRRLLSFARHEGQATARLDPDMLVAGLLPLLNHTLGGRVALRTNLAAQGWPVDVDARQFENAIINLAINARDAMPGGGTLTLATRTASLQAADIRCDRGERPGAYVVVVVSDTGQGMSPAVLARIFEPFFTTKADKGTGLGIPMVARFVRQAGGHIRVESVVGNGTTMCLYIPRSGAPI